MSLPKFGIQILNYNGSRWLPGLLQSLEACSYAEKRIYVVDNGSNDGSLEMVKASGLSIGLIENGHNLGFAGAYNLAAESAWRDGCDWLCLLNTDILVCPGWLEAVAELVSNNERIGIVGPLHWSWDSDSPSKFMRGRYSLPLEIFSGGESHASVDWIEGSCLFVRRSCWESLQGLDTRYFFYWEDADLCRRAKVRGWLVEMVGKSHVRHYGGGSSDRPEMKVNLLKQRYHFLYKLSDPNHGILLNIGSWLRLLVTFAGEILRGPQRILALWVTLNNVLWTVRHAGMIFRKWRDDQINNSVVTPSHYR